MAKNTPTKPNPAPAIIPIASSPSPVPEMPEVAHSEETFLPQALARVGLAGLPELECLSVKLPLLPRCERVHMIGDVQHRYIIIIDWRKKRRRSFCFFRRAFFLFACLFFYCVFLL